MIVFGHGGVGVEVIDDKAVALPPLDLALAHDLIGRTRVARLLAAYRNVPAAKVDEVALVLVRLAQLAADLPELRELDINPLLADETGVLALDMRIAVAPAAARFKGRRHIRASPCGPTRANGNAIWCSATTGASSSARSARRTRRWSALSSPR